jgi:hypothetical protein
MKGFNIGLNIAPNKRYVQDLGFTLSTCNIEYWLYSKNKLKDEDIRLDFTLFDKGSWLVHLERKDRVFVAQWRADNIFHINSQLLKYRSFIQWPAFNHPEEFPLFVKQLEQVLKITFVPHVNVSGLPDDKTRIENHEQVKSWLKSCVMSSGENMSGDAIGSEEEEQEEASPRKWVEPEKYLIHPVNEEIIEFKDFNFKLSIIQELMYHQNLIKPKFDANEFADWYSERRINLEKEGYDLIPEITQYFQDLPIPSRLAKNISEIDHDGSNEIYSSMFYFFDGEGDEFEIQSAEDVKHFPNLKKARLCYASNQVFDAFMQMGIDTSWL